MHYLFTNVKAEKPGNASLLDDCSFVQLVKVGGTGNFNEPERV
jgi:hypothetical protein